MWSRLCCARSLLQQFRPVGVRRANEAGDVGLPRLLHGRVIVQIELAVDDSPVFGIPLGCVSLADRPRAVAAVLWRVPLGFGFERCEVRGRREQPARAVPPGAELLRAFDGFAFGEIRDRVVPGQRVARKERRVYGVDSAAEAASRRPAMAVSVLIVRMGWVRC